MKKYTTSERLKQIMSERGLKQVDILRLAKPFCDKTGISLGKSSLNQYISGYAEPGQNKLYILGLALNVSEAWLMGYEVPIERTPQKEEGKRFTHSLENYSIAASIAKGAGIHLTEEEKTLLDLFRQIPEENRGMVLEMIRAAAKTQK